MIDDSKPKALAFVTGQCAERISVLARIYSQLTVGTRAFLLPETAKGKERNLIKVLQGINELHHTIANWLVPYTTVASKAFPVETLSQQLFQIGKQYRIEEFLTSVIQFIYTRSPAMTEKTIVQHAAEWFGKHCQELSDAFPTVRFRLNDASDKIGGKVNIELALENIACTITFWNKGEVEAIVLDASKKEKVLDDRRLTAQDEVALLLASYVEKVSAMSPSSPHV